MTTARATTTSAPAPLSGGRLYFVQWLRVFLISLVVAHHAAQPYGPTGGAWPVDDPASSDALLPLFAVNAAFFMGFFYLISGYFVAGSYDRHGGRAFVAGRLRRLGVPLVFFTLVVFPLLTYPGTGGFSDRLNFWFVDYLGRWKLEMGHLWFLAQLITWSLVYAAWRAIASARGAEASRRSWPPPDDRAVLVYVLALALVGAAVRTVWPQDVWVRLLWLVPAEPAHLPQYVSMFLIGVVAGRGQWFTRIGSGLGIRWFAAGVVAFALAAWLLGSPDLLPAFVGPDPTWGFFEAFVCVGMILGLTVLFRRYADGARGLVGRIDRYVFGVYVLHLFIVIGLHEVLLPYDLPALAKFGIVTVLAIVASFAVSAALARVPVVRDLVGLG